MMGRTLLGPLVFAAALGLSMQAQAKKANLTVTPSASDTTFTCEPGSTACFDVESGRNITHIFVDVDFAECADPPFQVFVDGTEITKLHDKGGPCNHGDKEIERWVWFPLTGNQDTAHVCVFVPNAVPGSVTVGAKSQNECVDASTESPYCSNCGGNECSN